MQPTTPQPGGAGGPEEQDLYRPAQTPQYVPAALPAAPPPPPPKAQADDLVTWEASEYIHRSKDALWTIGFLAVTLLFLGAAVWFQAWTFVALIIVMAVAMGFFAFRPPRIAKYSLSKDGLQINGKFYDFAEFRAFSVKPEEAFFVILLIPVKRFMPAITIYFAEADGEKIVDILGSYLPMEEVKPDPIDSFMRHIRF
jgi:hypothetical protein